MKTLNDVINAVQHETQLSRSQLSLKIGKSRNYLNTTVKNGLSYEKEQEIIALLLNLVDDEVIMLRNVLADKEETIEAYKAKLKEIINENLDIAKEKNDEIETLKEDKAKRHRELVGYENKCENMIDNLSETISTKNLFIDGLDMENKGLMDRISKLEKNLNKMCEINKGFTDIHNKQEETIKDLEQKIVILGKEIDNSHASKQALKQAIENLRVTNENLGKEIQSKNKTIDSIAKAGHTTGKQLNKEITKNRVLTASIIGLVAIFSVYLWVK